jgi:hypothetical protein
MTYTSSARQPEPEPRPAWTRGAERPPGGPESSAVNGAVKRFQRHAHHRSSHRPSACLPAR